jgi:hypothetical protein
VVAGVLHGAEHDDVVAGVDVPVEGALEVGSFAGHERELVVAEVWAEARRSGFRRRRRSGGRWARAGRRGWTRRKGRDHHERRTQAAEPVIWSETENRAMAGPAPCSRRTRSQPASRRPQVNDHQPRQHRVARDRASSRCSRIWRMTRRMRLALTSYVVMLLMPSACSRVPGRRVSPRTLVRVDT